MILRPFRRSAENRTINALYGTIVAQARSSAFYAAYGVPDTIQGRFDLIVLHLVLLLDRLAREDDAGRGLGQGLFDMFCRDLDDNLREMGVGDLAVSKQMRRFGEAFYGRQAVYIAALAAADERELEKALARNIFQGATHTEAARLARYARAAVKDLNAQEASTLMHGKLVFSKPEAIAHESHEL
jgi:cytochrome b pre-mRNA-processing protein 3